MSHPHIKSDEIIIVFGADIVGYGKTAQPGPECIQALRLAKKVQAVHQAAIVTFPCFSEKHQVMYHRIMRNWLETHGAYVGAQKLFQTAKTFDTVGEATAFWNYCLDWGECPPTKVYAVARGAHSIRATQTLEATCPQTWLDTVEIVTVRAPSYSLTLPVYEKLARLKYQRQPPERVVPFPTQS